jgi:serine/threonine protein kinase/tetratricopeptide (TPR) repeat protein
MDNIAQQDDHLMDLIAAALQKPPSERDACLRLACGNDAELYREASEVMREEEKMGSFLLHPMIAFKEFPRPFNVGQIVAERFEITREMGEGGMGVVYEAFDRKRNLRVAIKSAKPGFQRLLSPELEGALTVRHTNVCRVNEIHTAHTEHGEIDFLTMELLEGKTLSVHLKARGKLPEAEALPIARQLCAGVSEAHRSGVIHRDLKSANVILCQPSNVELRVVITDFGLAGGTAQPDDLAGTPVYMAPELWHGEKTSKSSDIYALGVIFYEMVADPTLGSLGSGEPSHPDTRGLSQRWAHTISRCLDDSPAARPADADEVLAGLEEHSSRKKWLLAFPLIVLLSLISPQVRARIHNGIWPPPQVRLVVLPADGSDSSLDMVSGVLQDVSRRISHLKSGSREVEVINPTAARNLSVQTLAQARNMHATHALQTSVRREGEDMVVQGSLIDLKNQTHVREFSNRYTPSTMGAMPAAITGAVSAGLQLRGGVNTEVLSPAATVPYDRGLHILTQDTQHLPEGIQLFEEAARLDSRSPLPLAGLVEAEVRSFGETKDSALLAKAEKDLQAAENLNPDSVSVHLAAGKLSEAEGQYEKAREQYVRVKDIEPRNADAFVRIAGVYDKLNMPEKALEAYQTAIEIDPTYYEPYEYLGVFYYRRGQYTEAAEQFKKVTELAPGMYRAYSNLAGALENLDRYAEAEQALRASLKIQETAAGLNNMGTILASQKRDAEAVPYYERSVALNPKDYVHLLNLADSNRRLGHVRTAQAEYKNGLALALSELSEDPRRPDVRAFVAYFAVRLGRRRRAEDEIKQALRLSPNDSQVVQMAVLTYEALGLRSLALVTLSGATPQLLSELDREPDLADFSHDPRFKQLVDGKIKGGN